MSDDLKFQLRLTLSDEFAHVARNDPGDPSISTLTDILTGHDAVMKCQFDAFAGYVSEAEANARALNAATLFELDDVIDPAETRSLIASTLAAAVLPGAPQASRPRFVDAW